jgi:hypothetical protein
MIFLSLFVYTSVCSDDVLCTIFGNSQRYQQHVRWKKMGSCFFFVVMFWSGLMEFLGFPFFVWNKYTLARGLKIVVSVESQTKKKSENFIADRSSSNLVWFNYLVILGCVEFVRCVPKGLWILCLWIFAFNDLCQGWGEAGEISLSVGLDCNWIFSVVRSFRVNSFVFQRFWFT